MLPDVIDGLWPVMLTPFTAQGEVDYAALERLIDWYEVNGASGLFAACQSGEVFYLSLREREALVSFTKRHAHIPVIASGHVSCALSEQIDELTRMRAAGADALILITNRPAGAGADGGAFLSALKALLRALPQDVPLGFYECPYPAKRLLSDEELRFCADTGRFRFMKDTCCDIDIIQRRLNVLSGSPLRLFNANTTTLLQSLRLGAAGFSGVMLNFHPELYAVLLRIWRANPAQAEHLQAYLTAFSMIERQAYPVNAKYHLSRILRVINDDYTRSMPADALTPTGMDEVRQLHDAAQMIYRRCCKM